MGVPSSLAMNLEALHRLIAVEGVLDGTGQHMVNARMAICRGRSLIENKLRTSLTLLDALQEHILCIPLVQYLLVGLIQVQTVVFGKFLSHIFLLLTLFFIPLLIIGRKITKKSCNPCK